MISNLGKTIRKAQEQAEQKGETQIAIAKNLLKSNSRKDFAKLP